MARRGPLTQAPGALKGGTLLKLPTFLSQLKGNPLAKKQIFEKKSQCRKTKGGPFGIFKHPFCCKLSKKLKGDPLKRRKKFFKVSQCRKTERGTLWGFSTSILSQNIKKLRGKFFLFSEKSLAVPKKTERGDPLV